MTMLQFFRDRRSVNRHFSFCLADNSKMQLTLQIISLIAIVYKDRIYFAEIQQFNR